MKFFGSTKSINNVLYIGGISIPELVKMYGTPLYVFDEELIRKNMREYKKYIRTNEGDRVAYAGKAFLTIAMCQIADQEGLYLDVVSGGELYTAKKAGFPMERIYFHGNNKTVSEIEMGIKLNVGRFVVDNLYEIRKINEIAQREHKVQKILIRITPGIEAHTHKYIRTGQIDSKFGFSIYDDETLEVIKKAVECKNVKLEGLHSHIGSQIFELAPYVDECEIMMNFMDKIKKETGYELNELDLGGGFGIYYKDGDEPHCIKDYCDTIYESIGKMSLKLNYKKPKIVIEPGRSIVGNAGITVYTAGAIKTIKNVRKYISVDGGMTDNIRPALYSAEYECVDAVNVHGIQNETVTISGKCCESGDILIHDISISKISSGDLIVVLSTGAYGYSMSSNYNKIPKPAAVMVNSGKVKLVCKRETYENIISNELFL